MVFILFSALATAAFTLVLMKRNIKDIVDPSRDGAIHDGARWLLLLIEVLNLSVSVYAIGHTLTELL